MTLNMRHYKQFLVDLNPAQLVEIQTYTATLLGDLRERHSLNTIKRPHMAMLERRGGNRFEIGLPGLCRDVREEPDAPSARHPMRVLDISETGYRLVGDVFFKPFQILSIEFSPPGQKRVHTLAQIMRVRKCHLPKSETYEYGCRTLSPELVAHARLESAHRTAIHKALEARELFPLLLIDAASDAENVARRLEQRGYPLARVASARQALPALRDAPGESAARLVLCPAASLVRAEAPAWLLALRKEFPHVATLALAATEKEYAQARWRAHADETVRPGAELEALEPALQRALYAHLAAPVEAPPPAPPTLKLLIAGSIEKNLRRQQTLLAREEFWIDKCLSCEGLLRELQMQMFDVLLVAEKLLGEDAPKRIAQIRAENPNLVIVVEAAEETRPQDLLSTEADLAIEAMASRKSLLKCMERARRIHRHSMILL